MDNALVESKVLQPETEDNSAHNLVAGKIDEFTQPKEPKLDQGLRECPLRMSRIKISWHLMKNKFSSYFIKRNPMWAYKHGGFFSRNIFINATKEKKTVNAPGFLKTTQN